MDAITAIETALVSGATAAAYSVGKSTISDAYEGLKRVLVDTYQLISTSLLDSDPRDPSYQQAVRTELLKHPEIVDDPEVLDKAKLLQKVLLYESLEQLTAWGVDVRKIEVADSVIIERVSGTTGGFRADQIKAKSLKISDAHGGSNARGKL